MSAISSTESIKNISPALLKNLKKHLVFDSCKSPQNHILGIESKITYADVKISSNESLEQFLKSTKYKKMPSLPKASYLVACVKGIQNKEFCVYGIYHPNEIEEHQQVNSQGGILKWKILKMAKKLFDELNQEIDFKSKTIYIDVDRETYTNYTDDQKKPYVENSISIVKRVAPQLFCNLL